MSDSRDRELRERARRLLQAVVDKDPFLVHRALDLAEAVLDAPPKGQADP